MRAFCLVSVAALLLAGCAAEPERAPDTRADGPAPGLPACEDCPQVFPEVWADNRAWGPTFEFKVNCGPGEPEDPLESCFLWDLDAVTVEPPNGTTIHLGKDFNVNAYSGEVTRRWVLYGPDGAGLPEHGFHAFRYHRGGEVVHEQRFLYEPTLMGWPTDISYERVGDDLHVAWTPPEGASAEHSYKILAFPDRGGVYSKRLPGDATSGVLEALPFDEGEGYLLRVSLYWSDRHNGGGYSTGPEIRTTW